MTLVRHTLAVVAALAVASCSGSPYSSADPGGTNDTSSASTPWDCYGPKPGHPEPGEQADFVASTFAAAQAAERAYGVPAAAILAMATNEGGYGFTRTALYANNVFGYKWVSAAAAGGRASYELTCQPDSDPGKRYIAFSDFRDGILFVSNKLATRTGAVDYKAATDRYRANRAAGVDVVTAVNAWIDGIADAGYNYDPPTYKRTLRAHANNYMKPGPSYSDAYNLYKYSADIIVAPETPDAGAPPAANISIDAPAAGVQVSGDVPFNASAHGGPVTTVRFSSRAAGDPGEFYVIKEGAVAPFGVAWATKGWVANGSYDLRVEAWNGATKIATETIRVVVAN